MISRAKAKLIRSLDRKKIRDREGLFMVEGNKMVGELLHQQGSVSTDIVEIIATEEWFQEHMDWMQQGDIRQTVGGEDEIKKLSHQVSPQAVIALVRIPEYDDDQGLPAGEAILGLESIRDPGNLGSIIRTADWFGIRLIVCSPDSVDVFNPKVVQSTMGAILRVRVHYLPLESFLGDPQMAERPVLGTFLGGENLYETDMGKNPVILFGNESRGLSVEAEAYLKRKITIPSFAEGRGSESLNLASSVAIVCSELRRQSS